MKKPNTNTTATGGYIAPAPELPTLLGSLTLALFLQSVFAGISGLPGELVRDKYQIDPPKSPGDEVNWLSFGVMESQADANAYSQSAVVDSEIVNVTQRMRALTVQCGFYGPLAEEYMELTEDGFQIQANRQALVQAGMNFTTTGIGHRVPDLVNERWVNRWEMSFYLTRNILRAYPILTFTQASGSLSAVLASGNLKTVNWKVNT